MPSPPPPAIALANLSRCAPNDSVRKVIDAYNVDADHETNIKSLMTFTLPSLTPCAAYLKVSSSGLKKAPLCDQIIMYIETYLPMHCDECSTTYEVDIEAESGPLLRCLICHQGCHNCPSMNEKAARLLELQKDLLSSAAWICSGCYKKNHPPAASSRHPIPPPPPTPPATILSAPNYNVKTELQTTRENAGNCPRYEQGSCPHGISGNKLHQDVVCLLLHPKRCRRFCRNGPRHKYGCSKGSECPKFHPTLCSESVSSKACFDKSCTSTHLKGTMRKQRSQNSNPSNRHAPPRVSSRPNISRNPPLTSNPPPNTPHASELSFLASSVHGMLKEITMLKQDMRLFSRQVPSGPPPTPAPFPHRTSASAHIQYAPTPFPCQPPSLPNQPPFSPQRLSMSTQPQPISYGPSPIHPRFLGRQPLPFSSSNQPLSIIPQPHTVPSSSQQPGPNMSQPPPGFSSSQHPLFTSSQPPFLQHPLQRYPPSSA